MEILQGIPVCAGVVWGRLKYFQRGNIEVKQDRVEDAPAEIRRFEKAHRAAKQELAELRAQAAVKVGEENALLFETHQMMLDDPDYTQSIYDCINSEVMNAEYAVLKTAEKFAKLFGSMTDEYMQARAADVEDISSRLLGILQNRSQDDLGIDEPVILAAADFLPSETARIDPGKVLALIAAGGAATSHTAIFARAMGIPAIIGLGKDLGPRLDGCEASVDAVEGIVYIHPDQETRIRLQRQKDAYDTDKEQLAAFKSRPSVTADGRQLSLYANIGSDSDLDAVLQSGAEGIGLLRSEFLYLGRNDYPEEQTLFTAYRKVVLGMGGKSVIIRTLDIGADKQVPYFQLEPEENPALGMRAIRICLSRPELFKTQLRALYRASAFGNLMIMFPMIISLAEVGRCKAIAAEVRMELRAENIDFRSDTPLGIMVETPAAALISDILAREVDFFSIGTNDLVQYTLACDRQNMNLAEFADPYSEAVLRLLRMTLENAHKAGIWCGICGEMGADPNMTRTLVDMGFDEISVAPSEVLPLRRRIAEIGK